MFAARGITAASLEHSLAPDAQRPFTRDVTLRIRRRFQRAAFDALREVPIAWLHHRVRQKMDNWITPALPRHRADRAVDLFAALPKLAPPKIAAAMWRTLWNGWVTRHRMSSLLLVGTSCIFGCQQGDDSIVHYANCRHVSKFAQDRLKPCRATSPPARLADFLVLDTKPSLICRDMLLRKCIRTAAVYRTHCAVRHGVVRSGPGAREALAQAAQQLVRGHGLATRALDGARVLCG